jgi:hypothetical protein
MKIVKNPNSQYKVDLKDKVALVYDYGSFIELAIRLIGHFKEVMYYAPYKNDYIKSSKWRIGTGIPGLTRVENFFDVIDDVDIFIFPDINDGDLQEDLVSRGKRVFGSKHGDELETKRLDAKEYFKKEGFDTNKAWEVVGLDNLKKELKDKKDLYIKIDKFRGNFETKHFEDYDLQLNWFRELEHELGDEAPYIKFIIEEPIHNVVEVGYDGFSIDGKFPTKSIFGYEIKDCGYACTVKMYDDLPQSIKDTNLSIGKVLADARYRNFFSCENRVNLKENYILDVCCRRGMPPGDLLDEMILNLPELIWFGSEGIMIEPIIEAKFGVEVMTYSEFAKDNFLTVKFPNKRRKNMKFKNLAIIGGEYCIVPVERKADDIGGIVAWDNTLEGAIEQVKEYAKELKGDYIDVKLSSINDIYDTIKKGEKMGIKF